MVPGETKTPGGTAGPHLPDAVQEGVGLEAACSWWPALPGDTTKASSVWRRAVCSSCRTLCSSCREGTGPRGPPRPQSGHLLVWKTGHCWHPHWLAQGPLAPSLGLVLFREGGALTPRTQGRPQGRASQGSPACLQGHGHIPELG